MRIVSISPLGQPYRSGRLPVLVKLANDRGETYCHHTTDEALADYGTFKTDVTASMAREWRRGGRQLDYGPDETHHKAWKQHIQEIAHKSTPQTFPKPTYEREIPPAQLSWERKQKLREQQEAANATDGQAS